MTASLTIGERIKALRERLGLTQTQLAAKVGKQPGSISRYECGELEPRAQALAELATALGCSIDYLVRGEQQSTAETSAR